MADHTHTTSPGPWVSAAACKGQPHLFLLGQTVTWRYPTHQRQQAQIYKAKRICDSCTVLQQCRTWALSDTDPAYDHIAGGLTPRERYEIKDRTTRGV